VYKSGTEYGTSQTNFKLELELEFYTLSVSPHNSVVKLKFDRPTNRKSQRHRAVLPAIARLYRLQSSSCSTHYTQWVPSRPALPIA